MENNNETQKNTLEEKILSKIKAGEVSMKPKYYFMLQVVLVCLLVVAVVLVSATLLSYIVFSLMASGHLFLLGFGLRGIMAFFVFFPWFVLLLDIVLVVLLDRLLARFKFAYNTPGLYLLVGTFGAVLVVGAIVYVTPLHSTLLREAEHKRLPVGGSLYMHLRRPPRADGVFRGTIVSMGTSTFVIAHNDKDTDTDDATNTVLLPPGVDITIFAQVGDEVFVAGDIDQGVIRSYGIQKITPQEPLK